MLLPQIGRPRRITGEQLRDGAWLIAWGYFLKVFVADNVAPLATAGFDPETPPPGVEVLLGVYPFPFQNLRGFSRLLKIPGGKFETLGSRVHKKFWFPYLGPPPRNLGSWGNNPPNGV